MAGRPISANTVNVRRSQFLGLISQSDKVINLITNSVESAKVRMEAGLKARESEVENLRSIGATDEMVAKFLANKGTIDYSADKGRIERAEAIINAVKVLSDNESALNHYLSSSAGSDIVNEVY